MSDQHSIYELIGGDAGVLELVTRFYDYMDQLPEVKLIRDLHPSDLGTSREKFYMFLSGWMGGPQRFVAAFGDVRLRARHLPFPIGEEERDQWMYCMAKALKDMQIDAAIKEHLISTFAQLATHMINKAPDVEA